MEPNCQFDWTNHDGQPLKQVNEPDGTSGSFLVNGPMVQSTDVAMAITSFICKSPNEVYIRPLYNEAIYEQLDADLQKTYANLTFDCPLRLELELVCVGYDGERFFRAKIIGFDSTNLCYVMDIDSGTTCWLPADNFYAMIPEFQQIPNMALRCSLADANSLFQIPNVAHILNELLNEAEEAFVIWPKSSIYMDEIRVIYWTRHGQTRVASDLHYQLSHVI